MKRIHGKLQYFSMDDGQCKLIDGDAENLFKILDDFFLSINGKKVNHIMSRDNYILMVDESSNYVFDKETMWMAIPVGFGGSNVLAYIEHCLLDLNGRTIFVEIENGVSLNIRSNDAESVFELYYTGGENSCAVPKDREKDVCQMGKGKDCCVFLTMSSDGFSCEKFNAPTARYLLQRLAIDTINAGRIGNCKVVGRK